jgi:hypothetical protein
MLIISKQHYERIAEASEPRYRKRLAHELRSDLGAYVEDLSDEHPGLRPALESAAAAAEDPALKAALAP